MTVAMKTPKTITTTTTTNTTDMRTSLLRLKTTNIKNRLTIAKQKP